MSAAAPPPRAATALSAAILLVASVPAATWAGAEPAEHPACALLRSGAVLTAAEVRSAFTDGAAPGDCDLAGVEAARVTEATGLLAASALLDLGLDARRLSLATIDLAAQGLSVDQAAFAVLLADRGLGLPQGVALAPAMQHAVAAVLGAGSGVSIAGIAEVLDGAGGASACLTPARVDDAPAEGTCAILDAGVCSGLPATFMLAADGPLGACAAYWAVAGLALGVLAASVVLLAEGMGAGEDAHGDAREAGATPPPTAPVQPGSTNRLRSLEGQGDWHLILEALGIAGGSGSFHTSLPACDACQYFSIPLGPIPDHGFAEQVADYGGSNPAPNPATFVDEPPTWRTEKGKRNWWKCGGAIGAIIVVSAASTAATVGSGGLLAAAAIGAGAGAVDGLILATDPCGQSVRMVHDPGRWGAEGFYQNCWGCQGAATWTGEVFNILGLLWLRTSVSVATPMVLPPDAFRNPDTNGWETQRRWYYDEDNKKRLTAYGLHRTWQAQTDAAAKAALVLGVHLSTTLPASTGSALRVLVQDGQSAVALDTRALMLVGQCPGTCGETEVLRVDSPGLGTLVPEGKNVKVDFTGTHGAATVTVLGLPIGGFTLKGALLAEVDPSV